MQVERQRASARWPQLHLSEVAYTAAGATTSTSASTSTQAQPGHDAASRPACRIRRSSPPFLYSSDGGWAHFNGVSFRLEKARIRPASSSWRTSSCRRRSTMDPGRSRRTTRRCAWDLDAGRVDLALRISGTAAPSATAYELPIRIRPAVALRWRRSVGACWRDGRCKGIARFASGVPVHDHVDERLPVRFVHPSARDTSRLQRGRQGEARPDPRRSCGTTRRRTSCRLRNAGTAGRNTLRGPGTQRVDLLRHQRVNMGPSTTGVSVGDLQPVEPYELRNPDGNISNPTAGMITTRTTAAACSSVASGVVRRRRKVVGVRSRPASAPT
jgi:hypothetical protein